jgi:hypothetical protein
MMKLGTLLTIGAVLAFLYGLALVVIPEPFLAFYAVTLPAPVPPLGTVLVYRLFGAALVGFALMNWFARNAPASDARRAIVIANFGADSLGFVLSAWGMLQPAVNALGWTTVVVYLLLASGFGYSLFVAKADL